MKAPKVYSSYSESFQKESSTITAIKFKAVHCIYIEKRQARLLLTIHASTHVAIEMKFRQTAHREIRNDNLKQEHNFIVFQKKRGTSYH